jgi:hypothetical protein
MRVTRLGPTKPILSLTGILSTSDIGPDGQVPTSNGSNSVAWGSNISDIFVNATTHVRGPFVNFADGSNTTITVDTVNGVASNTIRWHSTGGAGASFGSNSTHVSETTQVGASSNTARADHYHRGIETITASSSNTMQRGTWNLRPGSGIALSLTDTDGDGEFDTATIVNTGSGGGGGGTSTADPVRNQVGNGEVIIPGLAASADIKVAGASDDEFDTTDTSDPMTGWTTLGTPTSHDINSTAKSHYYVKQNAGGAVNLVGIYKAKSPAFTVTAKMTADTVLATAQGRAGLFIAEAAPGKIESIGHYTVSGGVPVGVAVDVWTNRTTFSSTPATSLYQTGAHLYLQIVVTSSTNVTYKFSYNGLLWHVLASARNPGFTVGAAGLLIDPNSSGDPVEALFDWIRFT